MRLSTEAERDEERGLATIAAALAAGVTVFDTARAYGAGQADLGHNERLLARALAGQSGARVVTKGGMSRPEGGWLPDGRARALRADCEASLEALAGVPIDIYLLHAPDPRTAWATSVRALLGLRERGLVPRVGLSGVNRRLLDEALALGPIDAVEVALGPFDSAALRGGVVQRCAELGIPVIAHSVLGGPARAARLGEHPVLAPIADKHGVGAGEVALAAALAVDPCVVALAGARRPESAARAAAAARLALDGEDRAALAGVLAPASLPAPAARQEGEVLLVMGLQGAGKSDAAADWIARGHRRLNRDATGGTVAELARLLDEELAAGARHLVLDNTYVTRASRRAVIEIAARHGVAVRGLWLETPIAAAQVNVVLRMLSQHGRLLEPDELARGRGPDALTPTAQFRTLRSLERPAADEGFASLEVVPFVRRPMTGGPARFFALDLLLDDDDQIRPGADALVAGDSPAFAFGWRPGRTEPIVPGLATAPGPGGGPGLEVRHCPHPGGPPRCWCRPPLPGLLLALAVERELDPAQCTIIGISPHHRAMADALGAAYQDGLTLAPPSPSS
jgi:aryl-alcohol dehydrogenase-like predicted oxidoreductase